MGGCPLLSVKYVFLYFCIVVTILLILSYDRHWIQENVPLFSSKPREPDKTRGSLARVKRFSVGKIKNIL